MGHKVPFVRFAFTEIDIELQLEFRNHMCGKDYVRWACMDRHPGRGSGFGFCGFSNDPQVVLDGSYQMALEDLERFQYIDAMRQLIAAGMMTQQEFDSKCQFIAWNFTKTVKELFGI
jgi:hypothetical protein